MHHATSAAARWPKMCGAACHSGAFLLCLCLCLCPSVAFVPPAQRLHAPASLRPQDPAGTPGAGRQKPALRMSAYDHDANDPVAMRVEAIMEVTPMQMVVRFFEGAYLAEPAQKQSDHLEASLAAPCAERPVDSELVVGDDEHEAAEAEAECTPEPRTSEVRYDPPPPAARPEVPSARAAAPAQQQPEIPTSSTPPPASRPVCEDAARILQRSQEMSNMPREDAYAVIARVNAMMREQERQARGEPERAHTPPP